MNGSEPYVFMAELLMWGLGGSIMVFLLVFCVSAGMGDISSTMVIAVVIFVQCGVLFAVGSMYDVPWCADHMRAENNEDGADSEDEEEGSITWGRREAP